MSHIRERLADLERPVGDIQLAGADAIRARGERLRRRRVLGAMAAVALVGAGTVSLALTDEVPAPLPTTVAASPSAPRMIECGTVTLGQAERLSDAVLTCFLQAVDDRRPVHLSVTRPTIEGDPIITTFDGDNGHVEVTIDSRQDRFGAREVTHQTCTGPVAREGWLAFADCAEPVKR